MNTNIQVNFKTVTFMVKEKKFTTKVTAMSEVSKMEGSMVMGITFIEIKLNTKVS